MVESLNEIYKGSATIIKNKQYFSAKDYIEPFVEKLKPYTDKTICLVKVADQLSLDGMEIDTIYNKVLVMGIFPEQYDIVAKNENLHKSITYHRVVCMSYALDVRIPVCKFYTGVVDQSMNFYAFGADCIQIQKIEPETPINYTGVDTIINNGLKDNCDFILNQNLSRILPKCDMLNKLGEWVDFTLKKEYINDAGKVKLSNTMPIESYKLLMMDKDSDYYSEDVSLYLPDILGAFLSQIADDDKDIVNRYEKTQLVNQMLKL